VNAADRERILSFAARVEAVAPQTPVALLGEGLDHAVYSVGETLLVRLAFEPDAGATDRDAQLLRLIAARSPLPVPVPELADDAAGCLVYRRLPGVPLLGVARPERARIAEAQAHRLAQFLVALHGTPADAVDGLIERDDTPLDAYVEEARATYATHAAHVPASAREPVEALLAAPPPAGPAAPCLCHADLGAEHLLADPSTATLTGVIDWSDAAVTDPALDLGRLLRDVGDTALAAILLHAAGAYAEDDGVGDRARTYAVCTALEDLAFGVEHDRPAYAANAREALEALAAQPPASTAS
jgi:aminoglycoside phosphotransferase (APT) family kinase protein